MISGDINVPYAYIIPDVQHFELERLTFISRRPKPSHSETNHSSQHLLNTAISMFFIRAPIPQKEEMVHRKSGFDGCKSLVADISFCQHFAVHKLYDSELENFHREKADASYFQKPRRAKCKRQLQGNLSEGLYCISKSQDFRRS